jgi:Zn-dependent peptidase ImmA (M78 family)
MAALQELDRLQPGCFSACTVQGRSGPVVVMNPLNSPARRVSDAMHELSHLMLRHETRRLERIAGLTFLTCDAVQEEEADQLSGTLLLPRPLLLAAHGRGMNAQSIAAEYGVSEQMARWRLNATGVALQQRRRQTG